MFSNNFSGAVGEYTATTVFKVGTARTNHVRTRQCFKKWKCILKTEEKLVRKAHRYGHSFSFYHKFTVQAGLARLNGLFRMALPLTLNLSVTIQD